MLQENDTIAAISTGMLSAAIGVVRLSGPDARRIAEELFTPAGGGRLTSHPARSAVHGRLHDGDEPVDDAVVTLFCAPASYTGEDMAELSCHGGLYLLQRVLTLCLRRGARMAEPGEFTKRAFLAGKLDLAQAEAVADLISARSAPAVRLAAGELAGSVSGAVRAVRGDLAGLAAQIMAHIDYPDEDIDDVGRDALCASLAAAEARLTRLAASYDEGSVLKEGVVTAIIGRPNVGKSALMNRLCRAERSIVTAIPGTTRDILEETVRLGELTLRLSDTAGLRASGDLAEAEGVRRAVARAEEARLLLCVFDASEPAADGDLRVIGLARGRTAVAVLNKSDLPERFDPEPLREAFSRVVRVSAKTGAGLSELSEAVRSLLLRGDMSPDEAPLTNVRHRDCVERAAAAVRSALAGARDGLPYDICEIDIETALGELGELTGETAADTLLETIFSRFCVGK